MKARCCVVVGFGLLLALLVPANLFAMGMGAKVIVRSNDKGSYHLVLRIGPAEKMGGMNGEQMLGGKMARCHMKMMAQGAGMGMGSGKCNHHVELHVYQRSSNAVIEHARVHIRLYCIKRKMNIEVPIMTMMAPKSGMKDYHYGNNVHTPNALFDVFVRVNGVRAEFKNVRLR